MTEDTNPAYWSEYTNLQHVKHKLIREYLNGWFPKLGFWNGRIVYLDTYAGRGTHRTGEIGSPVVAIQTLLTHSYRDRILERSEVAFFLIEHDPENVEALCREVTALGKLPERIKVHISCGDCFVQLEHIVTAIQGRRTDLAPAFVFVDPYGFKIPGDLIRRLMSAGRVEIFINIIWRELDMAMAQARKNVSDGMVETLNAIFRGDRWREIAGESSIDKRADQAVDLLRDLYGAEWVTSIRMLGDNQVTRYVLAHFTNHDDGRDLMKDCMWAVCPAGGFYARRSDNPNQTMLIEVEPNLVPLEEWLMKQLRAEPLRWSTLSVRLRSELWRNAQLWRVIRDCRQRRNPTAPAPFA